MFSYPLILNIPLIKWISPKWKKRFSLFSYSLNLLIHFYMTWPLVGIFLLLLHTYIQYIHSTEFLFAERKHQAAPQMKTFTKGILSIHYAMLLGLVNGKIILHCSLHFLMMVRANNTWANGHNLGQLYRLMEKLAAEREAWVCWK